MSRRGVRGFFAKEVADFKEGFDAGADDATGIYTWEDLDKLYSRERPFLVTLLHAAGTGFVLTVGRFAHVDALAAALLVAQIGVLVIARKSPRVAIPISVAIQFVLYARGNGPNIGIGAVIQSIVRLHKDRGWRTIESGGVPGPDVIAGVVGWCTVFVISIVPWALNWKSAAVLTGAARSHNPLVTFVVLFVLLAMASTGAEQASLFRGSQRRVDAAREEAIADERGRIARELHDVVAHQMSVVVAQAQGAEALVNREPAKVKKALATISATTRDALVELRRLLGVTRPAGGTGTGVIDPEGPQPGLSFDDLARLATTAEAAGLEVAMEIELDGPIDAGMALSAHRAIQEALTNAAKHAPGSPATVRVTAEPGQLVVEIVNGRPTKPLTPVPGSGVGLIGMRERVDVFGGTLEAGPTAEGGWRVRATFPATSVTP
jgi:signal transduction histidine kinase